MANAPSFIETIVVSTRIRLARNFASYPFPKKMDEAQAEDVAYLVGEGLKSLDEFVRYDIDKLTEDEASQLKERYLISPALQESKYGVAFITTDKTTSIMVNEEDHLREQYICKGFELYKAYERISSLDSLLGSSFDFAFNEKLGYLTACPSNLGTGMRASVMMFLPGLVTSGELKSFLPKIKEAGFTIRGAFGEGTSSEGYLYQVSNERTLGVSESEILEKMTRVTMGLSDLEIRAREVMKKTSGTELKDKALRAYGVLTNCALLTHKEFLDKMTQVRLGVALGYIESLDANGFDEFLNDMRPSTFRLGNGLKGKSERVCDMVRAETVCKVLPELVRIKRKKK